MLVTRRSDGRVGGCQRAATRTGTRRRSTTRRSRHQPGARGEPAEVQVEGQSPPA
ncbi:MAG: hypothetical protein KIT58_05345 [Planctomycetota bacterium]|nr:hypothetical protein [Planctomycetota bacterium]